MRFSAPTLLVALLAACSSSQVTLGLDVGDEKDALTRDPKVVTLTADVVDTSGTRTTLGTATLPADTIDLSDAPKTNFLHVEITGKDATNARVLFGRTVVLQLGAAAGNTLPIFVQRTGSWARLPSPLADSRSHPLVIPTTRTVLVGGGDEKQSQQVLTGYDFATLKALGAYGTTVAARSLVIANAAALLIGTGLGDDTKVSAVGYDLANAALFTFAVPSGGTLEEIVGGPTVQGDDGESYVVGPARATGTKTTRVLKVAKDGTATFLSFNQARLGAAAAWIKGYGLLVVGGGADKGAEILPKGATVSNVIELPTDPTVGASLAQLDDTHAIVVGGDQGGGTGAPSRIINPRCLTGCTADPWGANLPFTSTSTQLFGLDASSALLLAEDGTGATHTFVVDAKTITEIPTRIARHGARATRGPLGNIVLAGGGSGTLESYIP